MRETIVSMYDVRVNLGTFSSTGFSQDANFRDVCDFKLIAKFWTREENIAPILITRKLIPYYISKKQKF